MASGDTLILWNAINGELPPSGAAAFDVRNNRVCLDFSDITQESACFSSIMPNNYSGSGIGVYVHHASSGNSGNIGWIILFERIGDRQQDIDIDSFGVSQAIGPVDVSSTAGELDIVYTDFPSSGTDGIIAGEFFRMQIKRDVATDTCAADAELYAIELREL
jgi:hypothetical protein